MDGPIQFLSDNQSIRALANAFGIAAGIVIVWKGGGIALRFVRDVFSRNVKVAVARFRNRTYRIYLRSATDMYYFLTRAILVITMMVVSCTGFILISLTTISNSPSLLRERFNEQSLFKSFETYQDFSQWAHAISTAMMMLAMLISLGITMGLARNVARIRRKWRRRGRQL